MTSAVGKSGRYHHGDLRAALVAAAVELIAERGVGAFSMAEASRRIGVAVSAPYAHFADRDDLLAAVVVHAYEVFCRQLAAEVDPQHDPADRLAAIAACYVRFAGAHRPLFEAMARIDVDKRAHPEVVAAEKPLDDAVTGCVRDLYETPGEESDALVTAVEATAHGFAVMLLDGEFGDPGDAAEKAADRAAAATVALVEGRRHLGDRPGR